MGINTVTGIPPPGAVTDTDTLAVPVSNPSLTTRVAVYVPVLA